MQDRGTPKPQNSPQFSTANQTACVRENSASAAEIAIVGSGAVGQFYAAQLIWAGHHLRLLARRDAAALASRGLLVYQTPVPQVASSQILPTLQIEPQRFEVATDTRSFRRTQELDWVLITLKTTALDRAEALVRPLIGPHTKIVVLCNGLGVEDRFAQWFGAERVFGLLCFIGVNRSDDGTIHHKAFGHVAVGHFQDRVEQRESLVQLFESAGITCERTASLLEARWRKLGWNLPFNGLCLLYNCTTDGIVNSPERREFARQLARESVMVGNLDLAAHGQEARIDPGWAELQLSRTDTMGAYAPSTLLDARAGRELEMEAMFLEPARRAKMLGADTPALTRLMQGLCG